MKNDSWLTNYFLSFFSKIFIYFSKTFIINLYELYKYKQTELILNLNILIGFKLNHWFSKVIYKDFFSIHFNFIKFFSCWKLFISFYYIFFTFSSCNFRDYFVIQFALEIKFSFFSFENYVFFKLNHDQKLNILRSLIDSSGLFWDLYLNL